LPLTVSENISFHVSCSFITDYSILVYIETNTT